MGVHLILRRFAHRNNLRARSPTIYAAIDSLMSAGQTFVFAPIPNIAFCITSLSLDPLPIAPDFLFPVIPTIGLGANIDAEVDVNAVTTSG